MRRGVLRAGHHAVGQAQVHHEGAEVGDIRDRVARLQHGHSFVGAQPRVLLGEALAQLRVERVEHLRRGEIEPELRTPRAHLGLVAEDGQLGDLALDEGARRAEHAVVGALGEHDPLLLRPRPFEQAVLEHERGHHRRRAHLQQLEQRLLVDVRLEQRECGVVLALRLGGETSARLRDLRGRVVGAEVVARDRQGGVEALDQALDLRRQVEPAVQDDARQRREGSGCMGEQRREEHVRPVPRHDHDRPLGQPREHVLHRHRGDDHAERLALEQLGIPGDQRGRGRLEQGGDRRCDEEGILRDRPHGQLLIVDRGFDRRLDLRQLVGVRAVGDDRQQLGMRAVQLGGGEFGDLTHALRGTCGGAVRRPSPEHEQNRRPEVRGDARVEAQLGGAADVGEVGAEDDDGVALPFDGGETGDDLRQRGIRIRVHQVVVDPDALVVVEVDAVVVEEQLEHVVALRRGPRDGPEHSDAVDLVAEHLEHAERDRGLAGMTFGGRDVDADRHAFSLGSRA